MLVESKAPISSAELLAAPATRRGAPVFSLMKRNDDRINGSVPVWGQPTTPAEEVSQTLSAATSRVSPDTNLALSLAASEETQQPEESFGFFDLIDMINPLQHIPVVGTIYRAVTGDEIKPVSQIIGGAVFGGAIGAAGGVANAVVAAKTGKDIGATVLGFVMGEPSADAPQADTDTTLAVTSLSYRQPHYNE